MTKDEILKIKEHIEIHARREPRAIKITEIMWKAVDELERIAKLEQENAQLKEANETLATMNNNMWVELEMKRAESQGIANKLHQLIEAKEIMNIAIEGIKCWGIVGGNERPLEKQAEMLFNLFLDKAEQFIKGDSELQSKWINPARTTNDNEIKLNSEVEKCLS